MKSLRALRALARVELRDLRRHSGRSLLMLLLVAVPVAAAVGGSALARITEPTAAEQAAPTLGRAALRVDGALDHATRLAIGKHLPEHARTALVFAGLEDVGVPGLRLRAKLFALPPEELELGGSGPSGPGPSGPGQGGGLAAGMVRVERGRAPANAGEVALSPVLLAGLGRSLGDTVTLAYGAERTVTGIVVDPEDLDLPLVLRTPARVEHRGRHALLVDLPADDVPPVAAALRGAGYAVTTRAQAAAGAGALAHIVFALGSIGFLEAALVIAAAFAVALRRRQYEIGLLGSAGATSRQISVSLLASAAALAIVGGALGVAGGAGAAALVHPWLDGWNRRQNGGFEISPEHAAGAVLLGLVAALFAAALPARAAARVPVREALAGRRPVTARPRSWLAAGLALIAAGLGLLVFAPRDDVAAGALGVIGGPVLGVLGFGACSPWLLDALARRAGPLPLAWRLAVRDAGRFRARNGPVVTAVLAGMAMSVTVAVLVASLESAIDAFPAPYRTDQLLVAGPGAEAAARRMTADLSGLAAAPLVAVYSQGEPVRARYGGEASGLGRREWVACGGEELLLALGLEAAAEAFRAGRLLALEPPEDAADVELTAWLAGRRLARPPVEALPLAQRVSEPLFLLDRARLPAFGLEPGPPLNRSLIPWIVRLAQPVTRETLARAQAIAAESVRTSVDASLLHGRPARGFYRAVLAICALTGLVVVVVATALSAAESAGDTRVLHTVGAAPGLMRRHRAARAAYLALLGCVLAVPAGLFPAFGLFGMANFPLELVMPWRDLAVIALGLPAIAYAGTWLFGASGGVRWTS